MPGTLLGACFGRVGLQQWDWRDLSVLFPILEVESIVICCALLQQQSRHVCSRPSCRLYMRGVIQEVLSHIVGQQSMHSCLAADCDLLLNTLCAA